MTSTKDYYFSNEYQTESNLMYAFGITAYDMNGESIEDPSIGVLKPYYKTWGNDGSEINEISYIPVAMHQCTEQELQIGEYHDKSSSFY